MKGVDGFVWWILFAIVLWTLRAFSALKPEMGKRVNNFIFQGGCPLYRPPPARFMPLFLANSPLGPPAAPVFPPLLREAALPPALLADPETSEIPALRKFLYHP